MVDWFVSVCLSCQHFDGANKALKFCLSYVNNNNIGIVRTIIVWGLFHAQGSYFKICNQSSILTLDYYCMVGQQIIVRFCTAGTPNPRYPLSAPIEQWAYKFIEIT